MAYRGKPLGLAWLAALAASTVMLARAGEARADCSQPDFKVLWTYPADGDDRVPLNAQLWVLTSTWSSSATITLNGEPLTGSSQSFGGQAIDPGVLEADTDYALELRFGAGAVASGEEEVVTIDFHTGTEAAPAANAPRALDHTTAMGFGSHACGEVISAQDCFDTGQDTLLTVLTEDDDAIGWVIEVEGGYGGAVWPARCGGPSVYGYGPTLLQACALIRTIGPGGLLSEATRYCLDDSMTTDAAVPEPRDDASVPMSRQDAGVQAEPGGEPDDSSCSVGSHLGHGSAPGAMSLAWLLGLVAITRRARRTS